MNSRIRSGSTLSSAAMRSSAVASSPKISVASAARSRPSRVGEAMAVSTVCQSLASGERKMLSRDSSTAPTFKRASAPLTSPPNERLRTSTAMSLGRSALPSRVI